MTFRIPTVAALCFGFAIPAMAGQGTAAGASSQGGGVDASRLPVSAARIGRQIRQAEVREERNGLQLRYTVQVFGETPPIKLITPLDNLLTGNVPRTAPTHADMIRMMTPLEFSAPVIGLGSVPKRK
jgi:hypothetical protein